MKSFILMGLLPAMLLMAGGSARAAVTASYTIQPTVIELGSGNKTTVVDLGQKNELQHAIFKFQIKAPTTGTAQTVSDVLPGCGCTSVSNISFPLLLTLGHFSAPLQVHWNLNGRAGKSEVDLRIMADDGLLLHKVTLRCSIEAAVVVVPRRSVIEQADFFSEAGTSFTVTANSSPVTSMTYALDPSWEGALSVDGPSALAAYESTVVAIRYNKVTHKSKANLPPYGFCDVYVPDAASNRFAWSVKDEE